MQPSDSEIKKQLEEVFQKILDKTEVRIVPDPKDPFNLDKAMVWIITEPDPYEDFFIKLEPK